MTERNAPSARASNEVGAHSAARHAERGGFPTGRALAISFAAVASAFTVGIAADQTFSYRIRAATREFMGNAAPTILELASMRSRLRELEGRTDDLVQACRLGHDELPPSRLEDLRRLLREDWQIYKALPTFPGEASRWPDVEAALGRLEQVLERTFDDVAQGRADRADRRFRNEVRPDIEQLDSAIARVMVYDHEQGRAVARRIDALARVSTTVSALLVLVGAGLTALAASLAIRTARRYASSLRERADELEGFAGRVAHDIRSPLAATAAGLHLAGRLASEPAKMPIERAKRGVERVSRLVEGLLEFARAGAACSGDAAAGLAEVLDDVVADLRPEAERERVALDVGSVPHAQVACSPGVLTSILSNLVRNAITHMGKRALRRVRIDAVTGRGAGTVTILVEDTGPGVPDELRERIFEPFVRGPDAARPGCGLGLATVKRLVTAHGGSIAFSSGADGGTLFVVELLRAGPQRRVSRGQENIPQHSLHLAAARRP